MTFEEIYQTFSPRVFRLCMGYVNDNNWAKDITQETFIAVWQNLPKFRNESSVDTWIFRIASNNCLIQIEREKKMEKTELPLELTENTSEDNSEQEKFLYKCISELEETDRLIISLELEELPQVQIAEIVGISEGNVRVKIHRIKEKILKKFQQHEQFQRDKESVA
ncbi:RNA polymerase sigma factor [Solitalea canadensis]|uniref:RNA polymerase sigma factor, sigma-70 family n=1 Tax=Solitalea canadensis (strain ATCC 29591 / DSM 3403 / JCM 21819 / LMG 8368 / NBRC 15130 / NCIMB 12057 / USAM 9D) TaxID=929556 RepID=H8KP70_SOLCM|nr:RNA polymerase sigma factor [Solitalea canadensis]AFD05707.1 RNA polymerase sigma factor, sigma-70 family [Solitalea canadensis DSM 3403]